jgi:phosphoribosylamine---glycine ligase
MGSYSSALVTRKLHDKIQKKIVCPLVEAMAQRGTPYRGVLYAGLMITAAGSRYEYEEEPYVLEFNARFGDPEAQALLMRFKGDLFEPLYATATGQLATWIRGQGGLDAAMDSMWYDSHSISTTLASIGYPDAKDYKSKEIFGLDTIDALGDHVKVFHAGTRFGEGGKIFTNGGRVLSPTVLGTTHDMARILTEITIKKVNFEDMQFRDDIGL